MSDFLFYTFATVTLAAALLVVTNRNAVNSAVFLIVAFLGMASLFVLLEAYFLAVIQVLVYAGAVVVLFLFIIMLLGVKGGALRWLRPVSAVAGVLAAALLGFGLFIALRAGNLPEPPLPAVSPGASLEGFGRSLFTTYLLPMQVTGFLLLVAMIGVIILSKRLGARAGSHDPGRAPNAGEGHDQGRALQG